ncbi:MAG TPA: acyl carrier protein [Gemmatimonadaceae bacterium]|nr:acyl carrier protein [Gemmatimonadaceae bacterium]
MSAPPDHAIFVSQMVEWINRTLAPAGVTIDADTPLFAEGLINSIRILQLIAWTEHALDLRIPDTRIRMDSFRTVRHIADTFAGASTARGGGDVAA